MNELPHLPKQKRTPTLIRFCHWIKQRTEQGALSEINNPPQPLVKIAPGKADATSR